MRVLLLIGANLLLGLLIVPLLRDFWWKAVIRGRRDNGAPLHSLWKKVWVTAAMFLALGSTVLVNYIYGFGARQTRLEPFNTEEYDEEVQLESQQSVASQLLINQDQRRLLREIFDRAKTHAEYEDFDKAIKAYESLDSGRYGNEQIPVVPSVCVKNNLGIIYHLSKPQDPHALQRAAQVLENGADLASKDHLKKFRRKVNRNLFLLTEQ